MKKSTPYPPIEVRPLRDGEWVDFSEIGVPGVQLSGAGVKVAVHADAGNRITVSIPRKVVRDIETFIFATIVFWEEVHICRTELHFMKVYAGMKLVELADKLGVPADEMRKFVESGEGQFPKSKELRALMRSKAVEGLMNLASHIRAMNSENMAHVQDTLTGHEQAAEGWDWQQVPRPPKPGTAVPLDDETMARVDPKLMEHCAV